MALPESIKRKLRMFPPRTPEHKKILKDFEDAYDRAVADGDMEETRRLLLAFDAAYEEQKKRKAWLGIEDDPFDVGRRDEL